MDSLVGPGCPSGVLLPWLLSDVHVSATVSYSVCGLKFSHLFKDCEITPARPPPELMNATGREYAPSSCQPVAFVSKEITLCNRFCLAFCVQGEDDR